MSSAPAFASTPVNDGCLITTANTNRDGTGTLGTVHTPGGTGTRIDDIMIKARAATALAGMVRFFLFDGAAYHFWREIPVPVVAASASVPAFEQQLSGLGLIIKSGWSLKASTEKGDPFDITVTGAGAF